MARSSSATRQRATSAVTETLFTVANGYIGMRGNPEEGRDAYEHGTYINGFHETWPIRHAEAAFGFARTGQTIVNVPDAKLMKLYVDDEPLVSAPPTSSTTSAASTSATACCAAPWSGGRRRASGCGSTSTRMVSMTQRHLAVLTLEVTMLAGDAPVVDLLAAAQPPGRRGRVPRARRQAMGEGADPRKAGAFDGRVLQPAAAPTPTRTG